MAKKILIPPLILERIYSMYRQGYTYQTMHEVTGYNPITIANRCKGALLQRDKNQLKMPAKINKYDYLFEEPVCNGKMYADYFKKS